VQLVDPTGYGRILRDARGRVRAIVEHNDASAAQLRIREGNTGVMAVPARRLRGWLARLRSDNAQGEYYLTDVVAMAVRDRVAVRPLLAAEETEVLGVNDRLQLAQLEAALRAARATAALRAGATLADPARFDQRGSLELGRDVHIDVNVVFEGRVALGDGVRIGPNCLLRNVTIGAGTQVFANCVLEQAEVGAGCQLGPFARLRPGAQLADGVHIGNFVEVKNSRIGKGSKANHLTYLGDADVGAGVNIGAGTITCNYDGANKFRTVIGDGAFIGSGNMLVAPVAIGAQATTGAGSTLTRDAPAGKLTLARSRQATIEGWQRPARKKA
jgi:bifunctional UDP-N-acetylglucosamine pyrophosphorylase/glucosamine-1-phosphate N-acetyltransferase